MTSKEAIEKIRVLLFGKTEVKFAEATLKDGMVISYEMLEPGQMIYKMVEGVTEPLAEGEYEMEDGSILVIDANSILVEIKPMIEEVVEEVVEEEMEETPVEPTEIETRINAIEERITNIETALTSILEALGVQTEEMNSIRQEFSSQISEIANAPATTPVHVQPVEDQKPLSTAEKRLALLNQKK